jgi:hypothetical protein
VRSWAAARGPPSLQTHDRARCRADDLRPAGNIRSPEAVERPTEAAFSDRPLDVLVNNAAGNLTVLAAKHLVKDWAMETWYHSSIA